MFSTKRFVLAAVITPLLLTTAVHAQPPISFSHLRAGQEILIDTESQGCFGSSHFTLRYTVEKDPRVSITDMQPMRDGLNHVSPPPHEVGTAILSPGAVKRLDNLLKYYRKGSKGGCTSVETVTFVLQEAGKEIRRERYIDSTCGTDGLDANPKDLAELKIKDPPVINLRRIVWSVEEARKKGELTPVIAGYDPMWENGAEDEVQMRREKVRSQLMARILPGAAALRRQFVVEDTDLGDINSVPYSLHVTLKARRSRLVDAAWWWDPVEKARPLFDWHDFLTAHTVVERVVSRAPWVKAWKSQGKGRTVEAHIVGKRPSEEEDIRGEILPAWRHAGLKGSPSCEILFRVGDDYVGTAWFGMQDRRAIVTDVMVRKGVVAGSVFSLTNACFLPTQTVPAYIIVKPNGVAKLNKRKDPLAVGRKRQWDIK